MGRKNWKEAVSQKGPGRKTRKQKDPELPAQFREEDGKVKKVQTGTLGGRIKQRLRKRAAKEKLKVAIQKSYNAVPPPKTVSPTLLDHDSSKMELFHKSDGSSGKMSIT